MIDRPAPRFDLPSLFAGRPGFNTAELKGKVTLVNFFASWCAPCREEHPYLPELRQAGIPLVGIDYEDRPEDAKAWLLELGNPYKKIAVDPHGRAGIDFGSSGGPESFIVDRAGHIRYRQWGPFDQPTIDKTIMPLLDELTK